LTSLLADGVQPAAPPRPHLPPGTALPVPCFRLLQIARRSSICRTGIRDYIILANGRQASHGRTSSTMARLPWAAMSETGETSGGPKPGHAAWPHDTRNVPQQARSGAASDAERALPAQTCI
jgi:hypothetical protein